MVRHKQEVYDWFRNLDAPDRIDFMCSMLKLCLPIELRLFGTCIEQLAKKDYHALREFEQKANTAKDVQLLANMMHSDINNARSKLTIYLCLLHTRSTNICSAHFYNLLTSMSNDMERFASTSHIDDVVLDDIRLLLTIAIHHPVFSVMQQQEFLNQLETLRCLYQSQTEEDDRPAIEAEWNPSAHELIHLAQSAKSQTLLHDGTTAEARVTENHTVILNDNPTTAAPQISTQGKPAIISISVKTKEKTKSGCLVSMQVTLADGPSLTVKKSVQNIREFHNHLLQSYPEDANSKKNVRQIPFLRGALADEAHLHDVPVDEIGRLVQTYLSDLCKMPAKILQSSIVHEFFLSQNSIPTEKQTSYITSPRSALLPTPSAGAISNTSNVTGSVSSASQSHSPRPSSQQVSVNDLTRTRSSNHSMHDNQYMTMGHSPPEWSANVLTQSPRSPQHSHSINTQHIGSDLRKQTTEHFLKHHRLHKYAENLKDKPTVYQLLECDQTELRKRGLAKGAAHKLDETLNKLRIDESIPIQTIQSGSQDTPYPRASTTYQSSPSTSASLSQNLLGGSLPSDTSSSEYSPHVSPSARTGKHSNLHTDVRDPGIKQSSKGSDRHSPSVSQSHSLASVIKSTPRDANTMSKSSTSLPPQNNNSRQANTQHTSQRRNQSKSTEAPTGSALIRAASETSIGRRDISDPPNKRDLPVRGGGRNNNYKHADRGTDTFPRTNVASKESKESFRNDPPRRSISRENSNARVIPREMNSKSRNSPRDAQPKQQSRASQQNISLIDTKAVPTQTVELPLKSTTVVVPQEATLRESVPPNVQSVSISNPEEAPPGGLRPSRVSVGTGPPSLAQPELDSPIYMSNGLMTVEDPGYMQDPAQMMNAQQSGVNLEQAPYNNCTCAACCPHQYLSIPHGMMPLPPGNMPPGNMPPASMVTNQNGYVYSHQFVPTSNGLISPGMAPFNRQNNAGPPNGMMRDMVFPPFLMQQPRQPYPQGMVYYFPNKRQQQCTNCGSSNHASMECPEPSDTMSSPSNFQLDMQPRSDVSE